MCSPKGVRACSKTFRKRRVRARGLQVLAEALPSCRPGPLTGRVFKQALRANRVTFQASGTTRNISAHFVKNSLTRATT